MNTWRLSNIYMKTLLCEWKNHVTMTNKWQLPFDNLFGCKNGVTTGDHPKLLIFYLCRWLIKFSRFPTRTRKRYFHDSLMILSFFHRQPFFCE